MVAQGRGDLLLIGMRTLITGTLARRVSWVMTMEVERRGGGTDWTLKWGRRWDGCRFLDGSARLEGRAGEVLFPGREVNYALLEDEQPQVSDRWLSAHFIPSFNVRFLHRFRGPYSPRRARANLQNNLHFLKTKSVLGYKTFINSTRLADEKCRFGGRTRLEKSCPRGRLPWKTSPLQKMDTEQQFIRFIFPMDVVFLGGQMTHRLESLAGQSWRGSTSRKSSHF